jgi:hypothetical protein
MKRGRISIAGLVIFALALAGLYGCDTSGAPAPTAVTSANTPTITSPTTGVARNTPDSGTVPTAGSTEPTAGSTGPTPGGGAQSGSMGGWKVTPTDATAGSIKVTMNSVRTETEGILKPDAGSEYLILNLTFQNNGSTDAIISSILLFTLTDETNKEYSITITANLKPQIESVNEGKAPAGGSLTGEVGYEIPTSVKKLTFTYKPLLEEGTATFTLER